MSHSVIQSLEFQQSTNTFVNILIMNKRLLRASEEVKTSLVNPLGLVMVLTKTFLPKKIKLAIRDIREGGLCGGRSFLGRLLCHLARLHHPKLHLHCGAQVSILLLWTVGPYFVTVKVGTFLGVIIVALHA